ncbi:MAG: type II toxin-antitoxin system RelE/ParE family toxin [Candidatus Omnitrophica bacterium]|nr:type II toxin-antitoxin system RelE/ParE family toxin [Candidatus Omnitrophota bacterium]MBU0896665.1 type II toxin-antitoxin system RelE/ParE family toxin [Candidatus Omnitrophota bacterium]MBU1366405.1 type II toxin-antitoxin system RelE/ParE family toxin [Candidatus Omnitrophota bacterium]MBU1523467.1 type II toxin-antitoxin system RelE/ParE family toxin [Candidatus Omnitrophota bacterium]MBU1809561.1 type II toxin-antitoxin system RelE/ParE family toxin [Candidatus Omnitrophota bacterium
MDRYTCLFYQTSTGKLPVEDFICSLDSSSQDKFAYKKELLEQLGPQLRFPHTDILGNDIFELRFKGKEGQIRVLFFFFYRKQIILTHGFLKKTQKTPRKEIKIARQRKKDFFDKEA